MSTGLAKRSDSPIERVWDGVEVQLAVPEDLSIDSLRDERSVYVIHGPCCETQRHRQLIFARNTPHRRNHALEADEEHRRRQVDGLVRLVLVRACRLARAEIGELGTGQVKLHEALECETSVVQTEPARESVILRLVAVTCKVEHGSVG
jgi:hypothetical protein